MSPERIRVLHVMEALEGGTARHLVDIARHVSGFDHHVAIPSRRIGGATDEFAHAKLEAAGASIHVVEMRRSPSHPSNVRALLELRRLVLRLRPSIVHAHSSIGGVLGRVAALRTDTKRIYTPQGLASSRAALLVERALGAVTDRLIAASPSEAQLVLARRLIAAERLVTISNGIEHDELQDGPNLRHLLSIPAAAPIVGTVSRLVPQKAPDQFVRACAVVASQDPTAHFVLIGTGPLLDVVRAEARRLNLDDRFHLVAALPEAPSVLSQFDVFALASRFEGAPYAPLEAMRAGTPVVLTDVVGSHDAVEDGVSGVLVPRDDARALGRAILELLADADRRRRVGEAGRLRVKKHFDVAMMAAAIEDLYATTIATVDES